MSAVIPNCEFRFECPKKWEALQISPNPDQRFCGQCKREVRFCRTPEELEIAIARNECVAVELQREPAGRIAISLGNPKGPTYASKLPT